MTDLIRRMDAIQACQVGPSDEWSRATKDGYNQAATDCQRNILRIEPAPNAGAVKVKPLDRKSFPVLGSGGAWVDFQFVVDHGEQAKKNHHQSVARLAERGGLSWAELFAVLHNRPFKTIDANEAMIACRGLEAKYLAAIETTPDPRDAVIARLVDADILKAAGEEYILEHVMETDWHRMGRHSTVRGMMVRLGLYPKLEGAIDAALAAAKEVMK